MKIINLIACLLAVGGGTLRAQTNTPAAPPTTQTAIVRTKTLIDSKSMIFNNTTRQVIYSGSVRVDDPQMKLTCEQLTADFPQSGGHIDRLVALTNVVMDSVDEKGQTNHATSDMAVYSYKVVNGVTNETVTLSGNAKVESAQGWMTGEPIIWDRVNNSMSAMNQRMVLRQNIATALVNTNPPAVTSNLPPSVIQATNPPPAKTNVPPAFPIQSIQQVTNAPAVKTNLSPVVVQSNKLAVINSTATLTNIPAAKAQSAPPKAPRQM